jgi:hypothetical protein
VQRDEVSQRPHLLRLHRLAAHPVAADTGVPLEPLLREPVREDVGGSHALEPALLDRMDPGSAGEQSLRIS